MTILRTILRSASLLVPDGQRAEWLAEWSAELHYIRRRCPKAALRFCLGAFRDGLWLRANSPWRSLLLDSPGACIAVLLMAAAGAGLLAFWLHAPLLRPSAILISAAIALLVLPAVTTLSPADYCWDGRVRWWGFLVLKAALLLPIVYFGSIDLGALIAPDMKAHGPVAGFVAGFRWVLVDQRRRCPMCLRRLACPTRIGCSSRVLLDWYGTELICPRGHGLMHVPGLPASLYSAQRWVQLDGSWKSLFDVRAL